MAGIVDPDPFPLAPDEGYSPRNDLSTAADRRERTLGYRGTTIDKWLRERSRTDGRTTIRKRRRQGQRASSLGRKDGRGHEETQA
jgi:hypothetical protein